VIGISRALEILQVAACASRVRAGQVVVVVDVALCTLDGRMCAGQREAGSRVIEGRIQPAGCGVALLTGLRESRTDVVRIGRALEILQVAACASRVRAGQVVVVVDVALRALHGRMCPG